MQILQEQGYVDASNDKIILLGLQRTKALIEDIIFAIVIGFFMGNAFAGVLFEISFSVNRMYTGGYHAKSKKICNVISKSNTIMCLIIAFFCPINEEILCVTIIFSAFTILKLSPIESENKKVSDNEKRVYKHKSIVIIMLTILMCALFMWKDMFLYTRILCFALFSVAMGLKLARYTGV